MIKSSHPSKGTEIIGFLHTASQISRAYPAKTVKHLIIFADGLQEGHEVNLARMNVSDEQISKVIEQERLAGRLPKLGGISIWFVTGPSIHATQLVSSKLLRLEVFWREYIQICGGDLKEFGPTLVNFGDAP